MDEGKEEAQAPVWDVRGLVPIVPGRVPLAEQAPASELKKQITVFNEIITTEPSEDDELEMFKQTQMDCYTVLTELAVMQTTCQLLIDKGTPAALVDVITRGQPDEVKAMEVLIVMLRQGGPAVWSNSTSALNRLLTSLTDQVAVRKDEGLFGMCDILAFMLTMGPKKWVKSLVSAVTLMVKSKLGVDQRQRVLRLISSLVDYAGVECLVPPVASEPKVLLLVTHLAAIEIRMATENCTEQELHSQMGKLVSYYSLLENIIQYVIVDEELDLHHKQLAQLHTGMAGALNGVVYLLTRVAKGTFKLELRNPIVVASLRILGVWMAEEPEALKDEVIDLVPFLVNVIKMELGLIPVAEEPDDNTMVEKTAPSVSSSTTATKVNTCSGVAMETTAVTKTQDSSSSAASPQSDASEKSSSSGTSSALQDVSEKSSTEALSCVETSAEDTWKGAALSKPQVSSPSRSDSLDNDANGQGHGNSAGKCLPETCATAAPNVTCGSGARPKTTGGSRRQDSQTEGSSDSSTSIADLAKDFAVLLTVSGDGVANSQALTNEMASIDVTRFLLSGFVHITTVDETRDSMVEMSAHEAFINYYFNLHDRLVAQPLNAQLQTSMNQVCNILLNFAMFDSTFQLYSCHVTAIGVKLTRAQLSYHRIDGEQQRKFFAACITVISRCLNMLVEENDLVEDGMLDTWSEIQDLWTISLQEMTALLERLPELVEALLKSGWILVLIKLLLDPQMLAFGNNGENKPLLLAFIYKLAMTDKTARGIIAKHGGIELCRFHGLMDLEDLLQDV
ncbi:hypothetical protein BaRGS_00033433 [Batillaria attramentaria]|uniref:Uncharacterized protein n=1 Tax=Batillaria attramentaria TaxID=370345 RepID=A0ABD0JK06_9CAEN